MGSPILRKFAIFVAEEDPRWQKEYELNRAERAAQDHRYRQYRIERLYFSLHGLDPVCAEMLACAVWADERSRPDKLIDRRGFKVVGFAQ